MRSAVNSLAKSLVDSLAVWGAACAIAAAVPAPAAAEEGGWVPSLAVTGGVLMQEIEASVDSFCEDGGPANPANPFSADCLGHVIPPPQTVPLRPADSGSEWSVTPTVGFDLQLMTPAIPRVPGRPRVFAWGGIQLAFGSTRNTANEGDPTGAALPENRETLDSTPTIALVGTGSRTISEIQTLGWGAGAGIAFPFRLRGRQLWVKPGFAWNRYEIDVEGKVEAGLKNDPVDTPTTNSGYGSELRSISLSGKRSETYDGIGPSLEIEMDVFRYGSIGASLFLGGGAYRILGDREIHFSDSVSFPLGDPGTSPTPAYRLPADTYNANWSHEIDPWLYRARVGLRFSWLGN